MSASQKKDYDTAETAYKKAIEIKADYAEAYSGLANVYNATRKYYLLGRDLLLNELEPDDGSTVLEIGCGTGRNLIHAARRWPELSRPAASRRSSSICCSRL